MENKQIIKVGVSPDIDAKNLLNNYGFRVRSTLDLRYMAALAKCEPGTLAFMSEKFLGLTLRKGCDKALHFDWNKPYMSEKQIEYAAKDVHAAIELFKLFAKRLEHVSLFQQEEKFIEYVIFKYSSKFLNLYYNGAQGIPRELIGQRMSM